MNGNSPQPNQDPAARFRRAQRISADVRWLKLTPQERSEAMRELANRRWRKGK